MRAASSRSGQRIVPVRLRAAQRTYLTSVVGLPQGGELRRPRDLALRPIDPPPEGITLIKRLAERLGVARGDIITVEVMEGHSAPGHTRRRNRRGNTRHVRLYGDRRAQPADRRRGCRFGRGSVHRTLGHRARHRANQELPVIEWLSNSECPDFISLSRSGGFETYRDRGQFDQRMFEAFDELSHEDKIKRVDAVARKVVMRITEKGRIGDHERGPTYVPKRSVIA